MNLSRLKQLRLPALVAGCVALATSFGLAAEDRAPISAEPPAIDAPLAAPSAPASRETPCPHPYTININAANGQGAPLLSDFSPAAHLTAGLNETQPNKAFGYTFRVKAPGKCCQCAGGTLTVVYKALQNGSSLTGSDAGNDSSGLVFNGSSVTGSMGAIWGPTGVVTAGQTKTIVYNVPCKIISSGHVSLYAQDDTAVVSATLTIRGCCVDADMQAQ